MKSLEAVVFESWQLEFTQRSSQRTHLIPTGEYPMDPDERSRIILLSPGPFEFNDSGAAVGNEESMCNVANRGSSTAACASMVSIMPCAYNSLQVVGNLLESAWLYPQLGESWFSCWFGWSRTTASPQSAVVRDPASYLEYLLWNRGSRLQETSTIVERLHLRRETEQSTVNPKSAQRRHTIL